MSRERDQNSERERRAIHLHAVHHMARSYYTHTRTTRHMYRTRSGSALSLPFQLTPRGGIRLYTRGKLPPRLSLTSTYIKVAAESTCKLGRPPVLARRRDGRQQPLWRQRAAATRRAPSSSSSSSSLAHECGGEGEHRGTARPMRIDNDDTTTTSSTSSSSTSGML